MYFRTVESVWAPKYCFQAFEFVKGPMKEIMSHRYSYFQEREKLFISTERSNEEKSRSFSST